MNEGPFAIPLWNHEPVTSHSAIQDPAGYKNKQDGSYREQHVYAECTFLFYYLFFYFFLPHDEDPSSGDNTLFSPRAGESVSAAVDGCQQWGGNLAAPGGACLPSVPGIGDHVFLIFDAC